MVLQTLNCIQAFLFFCSGTNELNVMATPSLARKTADMTWDLASQHAFFQILFLWTFELSKAWCGGHPYQEHHCKWMSPTWHFTDSLLVGSRVWLNRPLCGARLPGLRVAPCQPTCRRPFSKQQIVITRHVTCCLYISWWKNTIKYIKIWGCNPYNW